jgi:hypothetical protein
MNHKYDFNKFVNEVNDWSGLSTDELSPEDLELFQSLVLEQYKEVVSKYDDNLCDILKINEYHESKIAKSELHKQIWPKKTRILSKARLQRLMGSQFFSELKAHFEWYNITDEENVGFPEVYFRLCRPEPFIDVGPLHADAWFWELGHGEMPKANFDIQRIKFWFCLETEEAKTGFRFVENSHKRDYNYAGIERDGFVKPTFDETKHDLLIKSFTGKPGSLIVFNDRLLHGGEILKSGTRVSLEFTLAIRNRL